MKISKKVATDLLTTLARIEAESSFTTVFGNNSALSINHFKEGLNSAADTEGLVTIDQLWYGQFAAKTNLWKYQNNELINSKSARQ